MARGGARGVRRKSLEDLIKRFEQGKPAPAVFLYGGDAYLRERARRRLVSACVPEGAREWGVSRYSAAETDLGVILQHVRTMPMLVPRQVVFVEEVEALELGGEAAREEAVGDLVAYFDDPVSFTVLVFEAAKLDERMKLARLLNEKAEVVPVRLPEDVGERTADAASMALEMAREEDAELPPESARELAEALDGNLSLMQTEVAKLAVHVGRKGRITPRVIEALTPPARKYSVWQLAEMLASRQAERAMTFLDSLMREGEQPAGIVGAMAWMFRKLLEAQELPKGAGVYEVARKLVMRVDTAKLAIAQAPRFSRESLRQALVALAETDNQLKWGTREPRALLEFVITRLCTVTPVK